MEINKIYHGRMEEVLLNFTENTVDSIVTDPPYGLSFMGKKWDYDVPSVAQWEEAFKVLKPGGYMLVACGTRTQHRMVVNIEDAGFEIRDVITWHYGSGFPKSLDISKAIDKAAGAEREVVREKSYEVTDGGGYSGNLNTSKPRSESCEITAPATDAAKEWEGWGTALKPATEFWTLCRKPLSENTVAENVLKHGTGGINIDACRIETEEKITNHSRGAESAKSKGKYGDSAEQETYQTAGQQLGRFPANLILDEFMAAELDKQSGILKSGDGGMRTSKTTKEQTFSGISPHGKEISYGDTGGASRFFYVAKPSQYERNKGLRGRQKRFLDEGGKEGSAGGTNPRNRGAENQRENFHPTVKPIELMRYLVKMITPKGGICLDPFTGSGTTLIACKLELMKYVGIEMDKDYCEIIDARVKAWNPETYKEQTLFNYEPELAQTNKI